MRYILTISLFTISLFGFDYHLKSYSIGDGIECFFGLSSEINSVNGANIVNSCYIESDDGYIVIDSGPTYSYAQQAYNIMQKKKKLPVQYVINTSSDEVHILGNGFYKEQGAILLGPKNYDKDKKITISDKITVDAFVNTRLVSLDRVIDADYNITCCDLNIRIAKIIKDSDRYLTVYIPDREIIFVGDMIFNNRIPAIKDNRSLLKWINAIEEIEKTPWRRLVSAHGIKTKLSAIKNTKKYLTMLRDEVTYNIQNGISKEKSIENITMLSFQDNRLYELWQSKNIATAYDELEKTEKKTRVKEIPKKVEIKKVIKKVIKIKKEKIKKIKKVPKITYYNYNRALSLAKQQGKILLIKIRSDNCPYCNELDKIMSKTSQVRKIINDNYKMVYLNNSRDELPLGIEIGLTPALVFIRPDKKKVVMTINGIQAIGELIDILNEGINDGRRNGYLN